MRRRITLVGVLALGLMSLAGCNFDAGSNNNAAASSASASTGGSTSAAGATEAKLQWEMPTENTNGTPLTDLQGYTIIYGESPEDLSNSVQISDAGTTSYVLSGLSRGTWYFAVLSYTTTGVNSALSNVVSMTIS